MKKLIFLIPLFFVLTFCQEEEQKEEYPILKGIFDIIEGIIGGTNKHWLTSSEEDEDLQGTIIDWILKAIVGGDSHPIQLTGMMPKRNKTRKNHTLTIKNKTNHRWNGYLIPEKSQNC